LNLSPVITFEVNDPKRHPRDPRCFDVLSGKQREMVHVHMTCAFCLWPILTDREHAEWLKVETGHRITCGRCLNTYTLKSKGDGKWLTSWVWKGWER
jgi:hypothetical protein